MSTSILMIIALIVLAICYILYGRYIARVYDLDPNHQTPAHTNKDGVDYVPTKAPILMGHHFASIAGAAPIIGPIVAAVFGWIPVMIWILLGTIFMGGVVSRQQKWHRLGDLIRGEVQAVSGMPETA